MVVAESRYVAEDALADVIVDIDPIDAVVDLEAALAPGARAGASASRIERGRACGAAQGGLRQRPRRR